MKCPACSNQDLKIAERKGIEIDFCPQCRGVWLDRGELDKIIERSAGPTAPQPGPAPYPPQRGYRQEERYDPRYKKKKKSLLGEIFDF